MNTTQPKHNPSSTTGGLILFGIFLAAYGSFVVANAWFPDSMTVQPIPGINLAVFLGLGLIFLTFAIAAIYVWMRFDERNGRNGTNPAEAGERVPRS